MVITNEALMKVFLFSVFPMWISIIYIFFKMKKNEQIMIVNSTEIQEQNKRIALFNGGIKYLKIDNLISTYAFLAKFKDGILEDEYFIQEVGECKIFKITDKVKGEITLIDYNEMGQIYATNAYLDNLKLYTMEYVDGKLSTGIEYDSSGRKSFCYSYNEVGEIIACDEYTYDQNNEMLVKHIDL